MRFLRPFALILLAAAAMYLAVALIWLIPDKRVEAHIVSHNAQP